MKMKKIIMVALLIAAMAAVAQAAYVDEGIIDVSFVSQVPDPVQPGEYFDARFKVSNLGTDPVNGLEIQFIDSYPFSLDPGDSAVQQIQSISALQKGDSGYIIKYKVRVDSNAVEGTNSVKLRYRVANGSWTNVEYPIDIQTADANLAILSVQTVPAKLSPGEQFDMQIRMKNLADSFVKDVSLKLDLTLSSLSSATNPPSLDALPFAPVNSASEKRVKVLNAGEEMVLTYSMVAYPSAESKVYKVPISLTFSDSVGTLHTKQDLVGIVVESPPQVSVVLDDSTITSTASQGDVTIKFVNKGLTGIKFLDVRLLENDYILPLSAEDVYIGNIDSDDYQTADFKVFVRKTDATNAKIPIHYEYVDSSNVKHQNDTTLDLRLAVKEESVQYQPKKSNTTTIIIIAAVVVLVGVIAYRVLRRRKK
jgi:hypothetical protein